MLADQLRFVQGALLALSVPGEAGGLVMASLVEDMREEHWIWQRALTEGNLWRDASSVGELLETLVARLGDVTAALEADGLVELCGQANAFFLEENLEEADLTIIWETWRGDLHGVQTGLAGVLQTMQQECMGAAGEVPAVAPAAQARGSGALGL